MEIAEEYGLTLQQVEAALDLLRIASGGDRNTHRQRRKARRASQWLNPDCISMPMRPCVLAEGVVDIGP